MDMEIDLADGVVIDIPDTAPQAEYVFLFVGRVPSSSVGSHTLVQQIEPNNAHNVISVRLPRFMHPAEMNLVATNAQGGWVSGMASGVGVSRTLEHQADGMWSLDRVAQAPRDIIFYNDGTHSATFPDAGWYRVASGGPVFGNQVTGTPFGPDDAIVLRTFGSEHAWTWTNPIPYAAPTQFLD